MGATMRRDRVLTGFVIASLVVHVNVGLLVVSYVRFTPEEPGDSKPLAVDLVSPEEVGERGAAELTAIDRQREQEEQKKEEEAEQKKEREAKGQVVDVAPPAIEKRPDKARFLSEHDITVPKETKGPHQDYRKGKLIPSRPLPQQGDQRPATPAEQAATERKVMKLAMRAGTDAVSNLPRSVHPVAPDGDEPAGQALPPGDPRIKVQGPLHPSTPGNKRVTMKDLQLSDGELARATGTRVNDYLKDVEDGDQTLVNTKRWRFATFFNRVKRQVAENWHPDVVYKRRDPAGNVYGFRDRLTILRVRLTPAGKLKEIELEKPCGVGFLDDEAMAAFKAAEPFPNPPVGLVDKDSGMIHFRFGFLFEISRRPGFRIFRYSD
jgi:TonB family protein